MAKIAIVNQYFVLIKCLGHPTAVINLIPEVVTYFPIPDSIVHDSIMLLERTAGTFPNVSKLVEGSKTSSGNSITMTDLLPRRLRSIYQVTVNHYSLENYFFMFSPTSNRRPGVEVLLHVPLERSYVLYNANRLLLLLHQLS